MSTSSTGSSATSARSGTATSITSHVSSSELFAGPVNVAVYPANCSEGILDGLLLAGRPTSRPPISSPRTVINDADMLLVELGDQPIRRLREVNRIIERSGFRWSLPSPSTNWPLSSRPAAS